MPAIKLYTQFKSDANTENTFTVDTMDAQSAALLTAAIQGIANAPAPTPNPYSVVIQLDVDGNRVVDLNKTCEKPEVTDKEKKFADALDQLINLNT